MANTISLIEYSKIYRAAIEDDWETAKHILGEEANVFYDFCAFAGFDVYADSPLHIAIGTGSSHHFVQELVDWIMHVGDLQMLRIRNKIENNALHCAAIVGNTKAAKVLISKDPEMAQITNGLGATALALASEKGLKDTLCYLIEVTKDVGEEEEETSPFRGHRGADLLASTIYYDFYDVALYLIKKYPDLVTEQNNSLVNQKTALEKLAQKPNAFPSGSKLGFLQRRIYSWIPVNKEKALESLITTQNPTYQASYGFIAFLWSVLQYFATNIKQVHESKVRHIQSQELGRLMCLTVMNKDDKKLAWDVFGRTLAAAVKHGIYELIEQCCHHYPVVVKYRVDGLNLFMCAIIERQEKVFNLVYQMSGHKVFTFDETTDSQGNALHIAGKLASQHRLNKVTGAALQMQRELQWFKEVEKFVPLSFKEISFNGNTPRMVFSSEHKELLKEAKTWMKDTSSSATVVAALIITIAFAAIFTPPGGDNNNGKSMFLNDAVFILFAISDAVALFSSSTSVMMFLAVLNSRFAEEDFLYALPKRLVLGLISLFISIAAIMVAFSATLELVLRDKIQWIAAPVVLLASVPVTLFLLLQYPLLVELVRSTYGRGVFYQQNKLLLH